MLANISVLATSTQVAPPNIALKLVIVSLLLLPEKEHEPCQTGKSPVFRRYARAETGKFHLRLFVFEQKCSPPNGVWHGFCL
jgi:hypothetical protein